MTILSAVDEHTKTVFFFAIFGFIYHYCFSLSANNPPVLNDIHVVAIMSIALNQGHSGTDIPRSFCRIMCLKYVYCENFPHRGWVVWLRPCVFYGFCVKLIRCFKCLILTFIKTLIILPYNTFHQIQCRLLNVKSAGFEAPAGWFFR